jgi:glycosyltransferase involved in cell wall biosynthesis
VVWLTAADVCVVVTTYNHAHYLEQALASIARQTLVAAQVVVVDDGSTDDPDSVLRDRPEIQLIRQRHHGLSSARNTGLAAARTTYILFLDADDVLCSDALAAGLACAGDHPGTAFVYGAHARADASLVPQGEPSYRAVGDDPFASLLRGNVVGMHATVLYRRMVLVAARGFDPSLTTCEDYDLYLRLAHRHPVASHPECVALYRWHGQNMSRDHRTMLRTVLGVHRRHRPLAEDDPERLAAYRAGRRNWRAYYAAQAAEDARVSQLSQGAALVARARVSPLATAEWLVATAGRILRQAVRSRR